jgi:deoxyribodipyrimidine photo-lyase
MQRLEAEATLDEQSMNPELDALLERPFDEEKFRAWSEGTTGWPFFDACMRYLRATGWINFRMRAMLQSVASYTLWLPWRASGAHLARQFLDYEPGIHWSQIQMQSGVTGINSVRAYSILKQSQDQDPEGEFIRQWVPELNDVPSEHIHEPWLMSDEEQREASCIIGTDYPEPIVDEKETRKEGISQAYKAKADAEAKRRSKLVYLVHGSRKRSRFQKASHLK